jgi:hypothetical protein
VSPSDKRVNQLGLVLELGDKWNVNAVRNSTEWKKVLELADEIKNNVRVIHLHKSQVIQFRLMCKFGTNTVV